MLIGDAIRMQHPLPSLVCLLAFCLVGCQTQNGVRPVRSDMALTVGGVFWPEETPGFETKTSKRVILSIPYGSICDVRELPGTGPGRAMVKVQVNDRWYTVWVDQLASPRWKSIDYLPFEDFAYVTFGSEADPDRNWEKTRVNLLKEANANKSELSGDSLREEFGLNTSSGLQTKHRCAASMALWQEMAK